MKDFRDEVALAVLLEMWRNPISAARIIKEGKARELSATDALAEAAYVMADAMVMQRGLRKVDMRAEETKAQLRRFGMSEETIAALDTP